MVFSEFRLIYISDRVHFLVLFQAQKPGSPGIRVQYKSMHIYFVPIFFYYLYLENIGLLQRITADVYTVFTIDFESRQAA